MGNPAGIQLKWLGRVGYRDAVVRQEASRDALINGTGAPSIYFLEHPPVVTIGRNSNEGDLLASPGILAAHGIAYEETSRGGQLTYHGPGQLVVYPVVSLTDLRLGVNKYVRALSTAVTDWLRPFGLQGTWRDDAPGVWVGSDGGRKIASVGLHVRRNVTMHGIAINLTTNLEHFALLRPCGFGADVMTSLVQEGGPSMGVRQAAYRFSDCLLKSLQCEGVWQDGLDR
jgi:lipoate-protein ligase B